MKKKWLIGTAAALAALAFTCSGCNLMVGGGNGSSVSDSSQDQPYVGDSSVEESGLTLNYNTAKVDVYDSLQLKAYLTDIEGTVEWRSSNPEVATVNENGLVSALKEGTATITAKVGELEATCALTAVKSTIAPVMELSDTEVSLKVAGEYTVNIQTTWKGKEVSGVEYSWNYEDAGQTSSSYVSYTIAQDGASVTFTGLAAGTETFVVSAVVNGITLVETVTVSTVQNDVSFEVEGVNFSSAGYTADLALIAEGGHVKEVTPTVKVFYQGAEKQGVALSWTSADTSIATVSSSGKITAVKVGKTTVSAPVTVEGKTATLTINVNVYVAEFVYTSQTKQELDLNGSGNATINLSEFALKGSLVKTELDGGEITASYASGKASFARGELGNIYGQRTMTFYLERKSGSTLLAREKVIIPIGVYRSISTAEQLNNLEKYVQMDGYDAYGDFRLTADIDMGGKSLTGVGTYSNSGVGWYATHAWKGTFDGQGHTISNTSEIGTNSGFFCAISAEGVVRNVNFYNVTVSGHSGLIATGNDGLIENVFVYGGFADNAGESGIPPSMIASRNGQGTIRNCFVIIDRNSLTMYGGMIAGNNTGTIEGCVGICLSGVVYSVGSQKQPGIKSAGECGPEGYGNTYVESQENYPDGTPRPHKTFTTYLQETKNYTYDDWAKTMLNKVLDANLGGTATLAVSQIAIGTTASIKVKHARYVSSFTTTSKGISINANGVITIGKDATVGEKVTVTVRYINGDTQTVSFTVAKGAIEVTQKSELNKRINNTATVDLSKFSSNPGTIEYVMVGTSKRTGWTSSGSKITFKASMFGQTSTDWGNFNITVKTTTETFTLPMFVYVSISSVSDLEDMIDYAYAGGTVIRGKGQDRYAYYLMTADIDLKMYPFKTAGGNNSVWADGNDGQGKGWTIRLAGTFDGNGHAIKNWDYSKMNLSTTSGSAWNKGLFSSIAPSGVVKNLRVLNATAYGSSLIATDNAGTIENVFIEARMLDGGASNIPVGLVAGKGSGKLKNCVVVCTQAPEDSSTSYGAMLIGRDCAATGCVAINVSGADIHAKGKNATPTGETTEQLDLGSNRVYHSWQEYEAGKDDTNLDDWAADLIAAVQAKN